MLQLVIAWTRVGVFAATAALTLLAVAGLIRLAEKKYTDRLFKVLVVEVVVICLGIFTGKIELPETVEQRCVDAGEVKGRQAAVEEIKPELQRIATEVAAREAILNKRVRGASVTTAEMMKVATPLKFDPKVLDAIRRMRPVAPGR